MSGGSLDQGKPHAQGAEAFFGEQSTAPSAPPVAEEKSLAMIAHLGGVFGFLVPLVIFLMKRDEQGRFVSDQAKEALNFQITIFLASIVAALSMILLIGFLLFPLVFVYNVVGCVLAGMAANNGKMFRYRFCLRLVK